MEKYIIQEICPRHRQQISRLLQENWGSTHFVSRGHIYVADQLPGYIAVRDGRIIGLITYHIEDDRCEIITLNSLEEGKGIGSCLIDTVKSKAKEKGCQRIWLITTNDNIQAFRYYQKRGFHLAALYPNALQRSRTLKPSIPLIGYDGIPIRDEIKFELIL